MTGVQQDQYDVAWPHRTMDGVPAKYAPPRWSSCPVPWITSDNRNIDAGGDGTVGRAATLYGLPLP